MPCYHPLQAYYGDEKPNGKRTIHFHKKSIITGSELELPCGNCIGCRLERSRQWAVRCIHEAECHENNCFITLTVKEEHMDQIFPNRSLDVRPFQLFMKKLRKRFGNGIRFFHCGEYGDKYGRPHYHACLFNHDFPDKRLWTRSTNFPLYRSEILEELWPYGHSSIGSVTFDSAAYVARYILKKVNGEPQQKHYERIDPTTGEVFDLKPEYTTMSRRPGIGKLWFDQFRDDVYPHDSLVSNGVEMKPPKYYDTLYEALDAESFADIKIDRSLRAIMLADDNTPERLAVREACKSDKISKFLKRSIDMES